MVASPKTCAVCNKTVTRPHVHGVGMPGAPGPVGRPIGPLDTKNVGPAARTNTMVGSPPTKRSVPPGLARYAAAKKKAGN